MEKIEIFEMPAWKDYELLDSGEGQKLERFGPYIFIRPESQAIWPKKSPEKWAEAAAEYKVSGGRGAWLKKRKIPARWEMNYKNLKFYAEPTPFRHFGVFPEQANHWDFIQEKIKKAKRPLKVLNLFGYTGLAALTAAEAGAAVTHVDASKQSITWARENQKLSGLEGKTIRWLPDDALKFLRREARRGERYDGIIIDPPKFGRGPKGEIWDLEKNLPELLAACRSVLADEPLFMIATIYSVNISAISLSQAVAEKMKDLGDKIEAGELAIREKSGGRLLPTAITARWSK